MRRFHKNNPGYNARAQREFYDIHPERKAAYRQGHIERHPIAFRLRKRLQGRLSKALSGHTKIGSTMELVGCSVQELREYLESQFLPGMSWENHGEWHVDHKRPCASFDDLSDPEQQRECFHFSNLQPLWALDNLRKGKK